MTGSLTVEPSEYVEFLAVPYQLDGRDRAGADCWGLARLVVADKLGAEIPALDGAVGWDDAARDSAKHGTARLLATQWRRLGDDERPQPWDVVVYQIMGALHIGTMLGDDHYLTTDMTVGFAYVESLTRDAFRKVAIEVYRYQGNSRG